MNFKKMILMTIMTLTAIGTAQAKDSHHAAQPVGVSSDTSLKWLINGNLRYTKGSFRRDGAQMKDVERLSSGQNPHAIVLSCSDSRVPPEVVFDQKLGEIFVVRTAGESLGDNVVGSIEYAVEHLGSQLIVVMGHTSCGAVKAAFNSLDGSTVGSASLDNLVKDIHPRIRQFKGKKPSENFEVEGWANTDGVAQDLLVKSQIIKEKVAKGELTIVSSLYDLHSGQVVFKDKPIKNEIKLRVPASVKKASAHH
jgi:carbonic anhydrase